MNKLKMSLALIALIIPLLLCAKKRNIYGAQNEAYKTIY